MPKPVDSRRARSEATKDALMRAAEKLISERGVENVSIRQIVAEAGQKNESALQYHFGSLSGLLQALLSERGEQVRLKRNELIDALLATTPEPSLRQLCALMIEPAFKLARANADFRRHLKAFANQLARSEASPLKLISSKGGGGEGGQRLGALLRAALPHLDEQDYRRRMDAAVLLCTTSMFHQAGQRGAFSGQSGELFLNSLIDGLCGLLSAPVSEQTQSLK